MKALSAVVGAAVLAGMSLAPALAATPLYATEPAAAQACGADEVVWINLDRGKYYHKNQSSFGKGNNGGYACAKAAHSQYREAHD